MKKFFTLVTAAVMATTMWAEVPTTFVQNQRTLPQEQSKATTLDVQKVQSTFATELSTFKVLPESAIDRQSVGTTKMTRKASMAESPVALYMQPEGTLLGSIDKAGLGLFMTYPAVFGTWMNGVDVWKWRNYSQNYTKIEYQNAFGIARPEYASLANSIDSEGNWLDTIPAQEKFDPTSYLGYRIPLQIVSNGLEKDSFALLSFASHRLDTLIENMWTISGIKMSDAFNIEGWKELYDWFPELKTPFWPMTQAQFYDIAMEEDENEPFFEIIGTLNKTEKTYQYCMGSTKIDVKKQDGSTVTYQPSGILQIFDKPMSPLYVHDVTLPISALTFKEDGLYYTTPNFDKMQMTIMSMDGNTIYAQTTATIDDTTNLGNLSFVNFKIEKEDEFGGKEIGVTLTDSFVVAISWTNNAENNFGVYYGLNTITGGMTLVYDANSEQYQHYLNGDAFITLNGIYNTLADGADMYGGVPADTVDVVIKEDNGYYFAFYKQEDVNELPPVVMALDLLYDTITYNYNYDIIAPDWAELDMEYDVVVDQDGYTAWDYGFYFLDIIYDPAEGSEEVPAIGDEIKLKQYGQEIVYRVVDVPPFTGLNEHTVGAKVSKYFDGKQIVIRKGNKRVNILGTEL